MDKQAQIIYDKLSGGRNSIYCGTCRGSEHCEDCHRKMIGWAISEEYAQQIADAIEALGR